MKKQSAVSTALIFGILLLARPLPAVMIKSLSGDVWIMRRGSENWSTARPDIDLAEGDKIRTGSKSWAVIAQLPAAKVVLRQNSIVAVESTNPQNWSVSLLQGGALSMLKDRQHKQNLSVKTLGGVVAAADSLFEMETEQDNSVQVFVMEGELLLKPSNDKQTLDIHLAKGQTYLIRNGVEPVTLSVAAPNAPARVQRERPQAESLSSSDDAPDNRADIRREAALIAIQDSWQEDAAQEVRSNQYQEGRVSVDATGHRYRHEDYLVRPSDRQFTYLSLTNQNGQSTYTSLSVLAQNPLPVDLSGVNLYQQENTTPMSNWAVRTERITSNGTDYYREWQDGGSPITMNGTSLIYQQVVFSNWYVELKSGSGSPVLLSHWIPTAAYLGGNPVDTTGDADLAADGVRDLPRGYQDYNSGITAGIGNDRPVDSLTAAQRLDLTNSTVTNAYATSEGYTRTAKAQVDDVDLNQVSASQLNNSTKTSRISTYTVPGGGTIVLRSDRYYLDSESHKTPFIERQILSVDVQNLTLETMFSSALLNGRTIGGFMNPAFYFQTDMVN